MFEAAWHTQDVYQEKHGHIGETTIRILDPVRQRLAKLFITLCNLSLRPVYCSHHRTLSRSNH